MTFEVQAHRGNDQLALRRLLAAAPSSLELDVGLSADGLVVAHDVDLGDASGLRLGQALRAAGDVTVVVEAKCFPPSTPGPIAFAAALAPYLERVELCSFSEGALLEATRLNEQLVTTFLIKEPVRLTAVAPTIGPRADLVTAELVDAAHGRGLRVVPWTVNDVRQMTALVDLGVDGLVTDEPALARAVADARLALAA